MKLWDQSLSLRLIKSVLDNLPLEHGGLPFVLPFAVHLDTFLTLRGFYLNHEILVTAQSPNSPSPPRIGL